MGSVGCAAPQRGLASIARPGESLRLLGVYCLLVTRFLVRAAQDSDAPELALLQGAIYAEGRWFVGDGPPSAETLRQRLRAVDAARTLYLVAVAGEVPIGWLELQRLYPRKLEHVAVLTLAVEAAYRRQGVARALLQASYPWARERGVKKIGLSVRAHNRAARTLYEREGFVLEGCERDQIFDAGAFEDNLLMAKFL